MALRRRSVLIAIAVAAAVVVVTVVVLLAVVRSSSGPSTAGRSSTPATTKAPTPARASTLRALAEPIGLRIGTAINSDQLAIDPAYRAIASREFSAVTPENAMKWQAVEPARGVFTWGQADAVVDFAQENGQLVRGHTLVWYRGFPDWLTAEGPSLSADQLRAILKDHIMSEVGHFKGKIWQWDVVNEAFNDNGTLRDNLFLEKLGPDYIADAFRWARAADPDALLFYNDFGLESTGKKLNAVYALLSKLKSEGVPIDGVGFETHLDTRLPTPNLTKNLQRFADRGLAVAVTEADVRTVVPVTPEALAAQVDRYAASLQSCLDVARCISYSVWGFGDAYSWVPGTYPTEGAADIYDQNLQPKPQFYALQDTLAAASDAPQRDKPKR